jgi:DNA polymerase type B, organellar and viral
LFNFLKVYFFIKGPRYISNAERQRLIARRIQRDRLQRELDQRAEDERLESELIEIRPHPLRKGLNGVIQVKQTSVTVIRARLERDANVTLLNLMHSFKRVLERIYNNAVQDLDDDDWVQVIIKPKTWTNPISTELRRKSDMSLAEIMMLVYDSAQSSTDINIADGLTVEIVTVRKATPSEQRGGGHFKKSSVASWCLAKNLRSMIEINNPDDNMCMARSIAVGLAYVNKSPRRGEMRKSRRNYQRETAQYYCNLANVSPDEKCGISHAKQFEEALNIRVKIVAGDLMEELVYRGSDELSHPAVYIFRTKRGEEYHYDSIIDIAAFFRYSHYCEVCDIGSQFAYSHRCADIPQNQWCFTCNKRVCALSGTSASIVCNICNKIARSSACEASHKKDKQSNGCLGRFCQHCQGKILRKRKRGGVWETNEEMLNRHKCNISCRICKEENISPLHRCFMQQTAFKDVIDKVVYIDFETRQDERVHVPVFCYFAWVFAESGETGEYAIGVEDDVNEQVGAFLFSEKFKGATIIAHNMRGFDGCFLLSYLTSHNIAPSGLILNGTKLISFEVPYLKIRIIDSLSFLPMRLCEMPNAFGLDISSHVKGYFPHFFTRVDNFDYNDLLENIPKSDFGYETMSVKEQSVFDVWYTEHVASGYVFNFREEMHKYCAQDVRILRDGVEEFRKTIKELSVELREQDKPDINIITRESFSTVDIQQSQIVQTDNSNDDSICDPIAYVTLAGLCHAMYKSIFLRENSIALIPNGGYAEQRYSNKAVEWLEYKRQAEKLNIVDVSNSSTGEAKIGTYRVDGYDEQNKTVYEFHGCFWHGHEKCVKDMNQIHPVTFITFAGMLAHTIKRSQELEQMGYSVETIWECEWEEFKETCDRELLNRVTSFAKGFLPLKPRNGFKGGRTETFSVIGQGDEDCKIQYADVNSLYPSVLNNQEFPIGHPELVTNPSITDLFKYFGFIKCKVIPPRKLYHPVLPDTQNNKLLFHLCTKCAIDGNIENCQHSDEERAIIGTFFSEELKLALEMGYRVDTLYSVLHFTQSSNDLFKGYIRAFYKIKILASSLPSDVDVFIQELKDREGICIAATDFRPNSARRWLAKILLNAFWGRFGMRLNKPQCKFITRVDQLTDILNDEKTKVNVLRVINDRMAFIGYTSKNDDLIPMTNNTNVYIAAITTAWARMQLYEHLRKCLSTNGETSKALYCDTDSVIYNSTAEFELPLGSHLGELTNELALDDYIVLFVSGGPKNYAFRTKKGVECVKVKGFSLHATNRKFFNVDTLYELMRTFVDNNVDADLQRVQCTNTRASRKHEKKKGAFI